MQAYFEMVFKLKRKKARERSACVLLMCSNRVVVFCVRLLEIDGYFQASSTC